MTASKKVKFNPWCDERPDPAEAPLLDDEWFAQTFPTTAFHMRAEMRAMERAQAPDAAVAALRADAFPLTVRVSPLGGAGDGDGGVPPKWALFLLRLVIATRAQREAMVGDLVEEFHTVILPEHGPRAARFWFWQQSVRSTVSILLNSSFGVLERVVALLRRPS